MSHRSIFIIFIWQAKSYWPKYQRGVQLLIQKWKLSFCINFTYIIHVWVNLVFLNFSPTVMHQYSVVFSKSVDMEHQFTSLLYLDYVLQIGVIAVLWISELNHYTRVPLYWSCKKCISHGNCKNQSFWNYFLEGCASLKMVGTSKVILLLYYLYFF